MAPKSSQSPSRSKSPARATPKKKPAAAATPKKAAATPKKKPAAATLPKSPADFYPAPGTAPPAPAPHPTDVDLFASYSRLWAVSEAVIGYGTVYLVPGCHSFFPTECVETPWWFYSQCILWLIVLLYPSRFTVVASMLVRVAQYWAQAPMTWESCYWANATELAFVAILLLCPLDTVVYQSQDLIRLMMGWFYVGAGFWKINTSFLDTSVSCGPVYVASLLATFVPEILRPSWLVAYALKSAAWMTILGECGIGICLLMPSQTLRRLGFVLSNLLHYAICITPFPNAVPLFGVFCYTRLFFVMPHAWTLALHEVVAFPKTRSGFAARAFVVALSAASASCTSEPGLTINWGIPAQTLLCCIGARAVYLDVQYDGFKEGTEQAKKAKAPTLGTMKSLLLSLNAFTWLSITLFYVFAAQTLGLMSIGAVSPFSAIREHGGSNHLFMPTALLQQSPYTNKYDLFSGGIVRVTYTDSDVMNALYPGNSTNDLRPEIRKMLTAHGHLAHEYHPTVMRMFGPKLASFIPHWKPDDGTPFPSYTVPGLELRRLLSDARAANESFVLEYDILPGLVGDEKWRKTAVASKVRVEEDGKGGLKCTALHGGRSMEEHGAPCGADELPMRPSPKGLLMKFLVWFPYPVNTGSEEMPCMD